MMGGRFLICGALLLSLIGGAPARAEDPPPTRVGRISVADGNVAVRPAAQEWADSGVNHPIAAGTAVRTAAHARAVLRIGAELIALSGGTELEVGQLDQNGAQFMLRRGRIGVHLSELDAARSIVIDIPQGVVWLLTPGDYDIAAGDDREAARLSVLDGRARFVGKGGDAAVATGDVAVLRGGDATQTTPEDAPADDFVAWWRPTTGDQAAPEALRHVSAEMTGYEALDAQGRWETIAEYGAVWFPTGDWAPYRFGHWRWMMPWGWTWIDDMAWGFAPSHYGRWAKIGGADADAGRWGWVPGKPVAHPAYIPAVVAFLGTAGVGLSYPGAFGPAVAWFPLAPGEAYWPSFTDDLAAIHRFNEDAVADPSTIGPGVNDDPPAVIVTGEYRNRRFASVVPRAVFLTGKPVAPALVEVPERRLENAPLLAGSPQISPQVSPSGPRPVVPGSVATAKRRAAPKLAKAMHTLARAMKPKAARAAVPVRAASAPASQPRGSAARPARPHVVGAPSARVVSLRHADARRR
jgi:hypothetical protein